MKSIFKEYLPYITSTAKFHGASEETSNRHDYVLFFASLFGERIISTKILEINDVNCYRRGIFWLAM